METLEKLCLAHGVSGAETDVARIMVESLKKSCGKAEIDEFGNVIARKGTGKKRVMLAAHMDEIGLMVKHVTKEGFLHFIKIGGIDDNLLLGQRVVVKGEKGDVAGVIGAKPIHLKKPEDRKKLTKYDDMFIDIGAKDDKDAAKRVAVGDVVGFPPTFGRMTGDFYYGKALDNRLGCAVLLCVMEKLPGNLRCEVVAVGTVQEEVGLKGARIAAFGLEPDLAFVIDSTVAGGMPGVKDQETNLRLGKGPAITLTEASGRGLITHPAVKKMLVAAAKKERIPYQIDVVEGGMTDGAVISLTRQGIPTGAVSVPARYIHSPAGVYSKRDVDAAVKLIVAAIKEIR